MLLRAALRNSRRLNVTSRHARMLFSTKPSTLHEESFLNGSTSMYAEQMWDLYQQDPNSVEASWKHYFDSVEGGKAFDANDYNNPITAESTNKKLATVSF